MKTLRDFAEIVDRQTIFVVMMSIIATYFCIQYDLTIELPTALIGIAIVFPIVFSINAAYKRRESALRYFASIKGHLIALFYAHRDWLPTHAPEHAERLKTILAGTVSAINTYLTSKTEQDNEDLQKVYTYFSELSLSMEKMRAAGLSGSEVSRSNQYLRSIIIDFEQMRNIHKYRTPTALRAYSQIFLNSFPILFAPYFANLSATYFPIIGYLVAIFYTLILVSLDNIQEALENPYDGLGADDLNLNVTDQYITLLNNLDPQ